MPTRIPRWGPERNRGQFLSSPFSHEHVRSPLPIVRCDIWMEGLTAFGELKQPRGPLRWLPSGIHEPLVDSLRKREFARCGRLSVELNFAPRIGRIFSRHVCLLRSGCVTPFRLIMFDGGGDLARPPRVIEYHIQIISVLISHTRLRDKL